MSGDHDDKATVDSAVPAEFVKTRPKRRDDDEELREFDFEKLKGELVDVRASGFDYRGTLVGADETELYLRAETRWLVLPLGRVTQVKKAAGPRRPVGGPPPGFPDDEKSEGETSPDPDPDDEPPAGDG